MNESISRDAGAEHGQELSPKDMEKLINGIDRQSRQRTTFYGDATEERINAGLRATPCLKINNTPIERHAFR